MEHRSHIKNRVTLPEDMTISSLLMPICLSLIGFRGLINNRRNEKEDRKMRGRHSEKH